MINPGLALVEELVFEVLDQRPVLALDVPLALGPVGDAVALFHPERLTRLLHLVAVELPSIVAGQDLWRTKSADEIIQCSDNAIRRLVAQFVAAYVTGKYILENKDVPESLAMRHRDQVTHDVVENSLCDDWAEWRHNLWDPFSKLVAN